MTRTIMALAAGVVIGAVGMSAAHHDSKDHAGKEQIKPLAAYEIVERLDGHEAKATIVEVGLAAGDAGSPHRHPGPVFGYVIEGEYELGIDDKPAKVLKQGETFYEPTGCLHRVSKNPGSKEKTRVLAIVLHPHDAKQLAIPEAEKN